MDKSIVLHETIGIFDYITAEMEMDAMIYRQEFERHRAEYSKTKIESELIFTFIFLQIYIECFLHQNMRRIIQCEFKPPRDSIHTTWLGGEKRKIPNKIDNFVTPWFTSVPNHIQKIAGIIKDQFSRINDIRNLLVHGHKIAAWSDSNGNFGSTPTKLFLSESQLAQSILEVNKLGSAWNDLLNNVSLECKSLKLIGDFKFIKI